MTTILMIVLIAACAKLWNRANVLELRVAALEWGDASRPSVLVPEMPVATPNTSRREPFVAEPELSPAPEWQPVAQPALHEVDPPTVRLEEAASPWQAPDRGARRYTFEHLFGRYLPIWAGGITLAVAGFLIVKYSIDAGLLSPAVRVLCGLLFGGGLIAGAELALRRDDVARDARIRQALSGAGIATLYASVLVAANLYMLIGPMTAFVGLAAITVVAGLLSLRFGAPSAVLGLVGGLAAPALVGSSSPNLPLLATYLALTVGGLGVVGRAQRWWWLGALAVAGGFGWGLLLLATGLDNAADTLSIGALTLALAIVVPLLISGRPGRLLQLGAGVAGCAQMAAIVGLGGFAPLEWSLYGLISAGVVWLSCRQPTFSSMSLTGLAIGGLLAVAWPTPTNGALTAVIALGAAIYGLPALWQVWRASGRVSDAVQIAAAATGVALIPIAHHWWLQPRVEFVPLAVLGAMIAGGAAALGWRVSGRKDGRFAILAITAIVLATLAAALAAPIWAIAPIVAVAATVGLQLGLRADDRRIVSGATAILAGGVILLALYDVGETVRALGMTGLADVQGVVRWSVGALAALAFARWSPDRVIARVAEGAVALFGYVALAQVIPSPWLALVPAAMLAGLAAMRRAPVAEAVAASLSVAWATIPLSTWLLAGAASLAGLPFYAGLLPALDDVLVRLAAPAAMAAMLLWRRPMPRMVRLAGWAAIAALAMIVAHVLWKQVFLLDSATFAASGMAERTLWEALLAIVALLAWRFKASMIATALGGAALLHAGWFTIVLHNPLWTDQLAGPWLVPAYSIALGLVWLSSTALTGTAADRGRDYTRMVVIMLLSASLLRQLFHGSLLSEPGVSQAEDIGRSLLAIGLAIGFLQWGIRRGSRDWRIASLALMLVAVGKVFLIDAAGLDGLLRIGSFAALGFSLIGVGWLYSRYLPDPLTEESHSADIHPADTRG